MTKEADDGMVPSDRGNGLDDLQIATCGWVSWFNEERIRRTHDRSPAQVEAAYYRHQSQPDAA